MPWHGWAESELGLYYNSPVVVKDVYVKKHFPKRWLVQNNLNKIYIQEWQQLLGVVCSEHYVASIYIMSEEMNELEFVEIFPPKNVEIDKLW